MSAEGWIVMTLREAGVSLLDCEHKTPPAREIGYPYVAIPQIKNGRIDLKGARFITREDLTTWTRKAKPQAHDVVLSRRCNPGETAFVPPTLEFALGQNLVLLRSDGKKLYPPFLRWIVRGPEWWDQIQKYLNAGAIFDSLKCADIPEFELSVPPLSTQTRIAAILSTLDDKIELNRQTNATLEAIAQAIFKEWFVDFRFPGATGEMQDVGVGCMNWAGLEPAPTGTHALPEIVRQMKTFSARRINGKRGTQRVPVWQRNYYEHIIRNEDDLNSIRRYIANNPDNWQSDENYILTSSNAVTEDFSVTATH